MTAIRLFQTIPAVLLACALAPRQAVARPTDPPPSVPKDVQKVAPAAASPAALAVGSRGAEALRLFGKLEDDRALVYINSGPPDARQAISCSDLFRPLEVWTYLEHPKLGEKARILFFQESGTRVYRYWTVLEGEPVLLSPTATLPGPLLETDPAKTACGDTALVLAAFREISKRQVDNNGGLAERSALAVPHVMAPLKPGEKAAPAAPLLVSSKPLTGKERKKAMEVMPEKYRQFLTDVEPILTDLERDTMLRLSSDYQRDAFIEGFWKRRSVGADGMRVAFRDIYELRLKQVRELFRGPFTDQAKIFLANGPPDGIKKIDCQDIYWPIQIWYYERLESIRASKVLLVFYQPFAAGDYQLWTPMDGVFAIQVGGLPGLAGASASRRVDQTRCSEYRDVMAALNATSAFLGGASGMKTVEEIKQGQKPDVEGVDHILQMTTDLSADSSKLPIQRVLRFPEMVANKIRMELALMLERDSLTTKQVGDESFFDIDVVGEIVKGDRLVDNFRYRFDFPTGSVNGAFVPLMIERELYPGEYRLKVKVADANRNAGAVLSEKLTIPEVPDSTLTAAEKAAREAAKVAITRLAENPGARGSISIVPIAREIATGLIRFETRATSNDITFTEFYLDNTRVMTKRRPPFDADLDLGTLPRRHIVKVIGYAKDGKAIAEDELVLNEGREAFRIRLTSPEKGIALEGPTRVVADVAVPETKRLKDVAIYVNEAKVATLFQAPFQQVVEVPKSKELGYIRVVAQLEDGTTTEDLRYFNAPKYLSEVSVQAVELYTSVLAKGRPVPGLSQANFSILEDGVPQSVDGFEVVTNLPLSLGIGVDTSGSMEESIIEAQKAASQFLKDVMTKRDRCFLVSFDNEPQLISRFTTDRDRIAQALAGLRAQGSTALWDAIVYGLYQYQGVRGRKAYVILTDGEDRASKFSFEASLDYAKKTGVALYFIGLKIGAAQLDVKYKLGKMARETGGAVYYVDSARNLDKIYKEIDEELRSQYLLTYVPQNKSVSNAWRKIEVKMNPGNLTARTISGYYP